MAQSDPIPHGPTRGCAACRARLPAAELIRFAHDGASVVVDLDRRMPGRGVNLGPTRACLARAIKRGAFARGFKRPVPARDVEGLGESLALTFLDRLIHYMESSRRSQGVVDAPSRDEVEPPELRALVAATDGELRGIRIPQVRALTPAAAARITWLARGVSEFTFDMAGGMKRRPESPEPCVLVRASAHTARENE